VIRALVAPVLLACAVALTACGGGSSSGGARVPSTQSTPSQRPDAGAGGAATAAPTGPAPAPAPTGATGDAPKRPDPGGASADEAGAGGVGDEEPIRQPARFTVDARDVRPASVTVAPFLAISLEVVNRDGTSHRVKLVGTDVAFVVPSGRTEQRRLPGLAAGMYTLAVDGGAAAASLVVGDEAGP